MSGAVGIVGGTFDPIHVGHLAMAQEAQHQLGLEQVLLIPAGNPWQRTPEASAQDRLAMARLAAETSGLMKVDAREVQRARPSYTIDTLLELRAELGPERPLWLILGADAFLNLPTWHRSEELLQHANIAVACRPGVDLGSGILGSDLKIPKAAGTIVRLDMPLLDISSSEIRDALRHHRPTGHLLPAPVLDYIESHRLYL